MNHEHVHQNRQAPKKLPLVGVTREKDPVCGMDVPPDAPLGNVILPPEGAEVREET